MREGTKQLFGRIKHSWQEYLEQKKTIRDIVMVFWTCTWILLWVNFVLPLMKMNDVEPKIGLVIIGFVLTSLLLVTGDLPRYCSQLTLWIIKEIRKI